ncbi:MAG: hypothetical protein ABIQ53_12780 [Terracoccus sp.]
MTTTNSSLSSMPKGAKKTTPPGERAAVRELVKAARARDLSEESSTTRVHPTFTRGAAHETDGRGTVEQ